MDALSAVVLALAAGVLPMVVYAFVLGWFDRYEKEPGGLLVAAFAWGAVPAILFSLGTQLLLDIPISYFIEPAADLVGIAVIAPVTEEVFKGAAVLLLLLLYRKELDSPIDGIVYGGLVGFGFAAVENVLYFFSEAVESGVGALLWLAVLRAFVFGLNHALFTGLTGLGLALRRTSANRAVRYVAPVAGLLLAITAHAIHNTGVTLAAELVWPCFVAVISDWGGVILLLVIVIAVSVRERRWIVTYLREEVDRGILSARLFTQTASYGGRLAERAAALFSGDVRRWWELGLCYRLATELAFAKRHLAECPGEHGTAERVEQLRREVSESCQRLGAPRAE
jgi:RsiW-degrading membrane proteinase PrsW (M82 family)